MNFSCEKVDLQKKIMVAKNISNRNPLSCFSNILLKTEDNRLIIRSILDDDGYTTGFETSIPANIQKYGAVLVNCKDLLSILRELPKGVINLHIQDSEKSEDATEKLVIASQSKKLNFKLRIDSAEENFEMGWTNKENFFQIQQDIFFDMVAKTIISVDVKSTKVFMQGVYFENSEDAIRMVATNGKILSLVVQDENGSIPIFSVIIPNKILSLFSKLTSKKGLISIGVTKSHIFMDFDNQKLSSVFINESYVNYKRVIPENFEYEVIINRGMFIDAVKNVSVLVRNNLNLIHLDFSKGILKLRSGDNYSGKAEVEILCNYEGVDLTAPLNFDFLLKLLQVIDSEKIILKFNKSFDNIIQTALFIKEFKEYSICKDKKFKQESLFLIILIKKI